MKDVDWSKQQVADSTLAMVVELVRLKLCPEKSSIKTATPIVFEIHSRMAKVVIG